MTPRSWPDWWKWELELCDHLLERMIDREFTETDLRTMLDCAEGYRSNERYPGRFLIDTRHAEAKWVVSVEPDDQESVLVVITAYRVE